MYRLPFICFFYFSTLGLLQAQEKQPLSTSINSSFIETRPLVSPSGKQLYFSRREHPDNIAGDKDEQDIWMADYSLDSLNPKVQNLGKLVNSRKLDALASVSPDNQELIVYNNKKYDTAPLLRLKMKNGTWSKSEEIVIQDFYNLSPYSDFYYSFKQNAILMALKRADSRGGQDLFVSFKISENSWTQPISLGGTVNTRKDDFAPYLGADGKSLFYCSYGLKGEGKADIYYSYRLDDTWTNWSAPINIGKGVNTRNEEIYVSVSPDFKYVYFDSYSPEDKDRNVYRSLLSEQFYPKKVVVKVDSVVIAKVETKINPIVKASDTLVIAQVEEIQIKALPEIKEDAYQPITQVLADNSVNIDNEFILLQPAEELSETVENEHKEKISSNIYFDFSKFTVKGDVKEQLSPILNMLESNPDIQIELEGHADDKGTREANIDISYKRAQAIRRHLVKEGVDPDRIKLSWKGDTEPMASNDDEKDGRELNRRVEVFVLN